MRCIFRSTNTNPGPIRFLHKDINENIEVTPEKRHSLGIITSTKSTGSSGYQSGVSEKISMIESSLSLESVTDQTDGGLKCVYQSEVNGPLRTTPKWKTSHVMRSHSDVGKVMADRKRASPIR